jgi:hypothetical protein
LRPSGREPRIIGIARSEEVFCLRARNGIGLLVTAALLLPAYPATGHTSSGIKAQQRVLAKHQNLDRSEARVQLRLTNRRFQSVRLVCETIISDKWFHPTTGETRTYSEDWFLQYNNFPARTRGKSKKDVLSVEHPELAADPAWQPQGVTVKTPHCHARPR